MTHHYPSVSVIMPIRNEAVFIERSLGAMLSQDYPGKIEVIAVDGMSDDNTRNIIQRIARTDERVRLVDNPHRIVPPAMNIGIREARYELIARMDGHTVAPSDYLSRCVEVMQQTGADCVGGRWQYQAQTYIAQAIAVAMESMFGVGNADWRGSNTPGETDTVPFGMWERQRMIELGGFDESLVRNQDYEFNYRLRAAGGRIYYSPDIKTTYYSRQNLSALWSQYKQYGLWKARVLKKHPDSLQARHLASPLFVAGLLGGLLILPFRKWRWLYAVGLGLYLLMSLFFSIKQAARRGWRYLPVIPVVFLILHTAWGIGFWIGMWRWLVSPSPE